MRCFFYISKILAKVAQLVEHHVANVRVEGSNPFFRSIIQFHLWRRGQVVRQRSAKSPSPVRIWSTPQTKVAEVAKLVDARDLKSLDYL